MPAPIAPTQFTVITTASVDEENMSPSTDLKFAKATFSSYWLQRFAVEQILVSSDPSTWPTWISSTPNFGWYVGVKSSQLNKFVEVNLETRTLETGNHKTFKVWLWGFLGWIRVNSFQNILYIFENRFRCCDLDNSWSFWACEWFKFQCGAATFPQFN